MQIPLNDRHAQVNVFINRQNFVCSILCGLFAAITISIPQNFCWVQAKSGGIPATLITGAAGAGKYTSLSIVNVFFQTLKGYSILTLIDASISGFM